MFLVWTPISRKNSVAETIHNYNKNLITYYNLDHSYNRTSKKLWSVFCLSFGLTDDLFVWFCNSSCHDATLRHSVGCVFTKLKLLFETLCYATEWSEKLYASFLANYKNMQFLVCVWNSTQAVGNGNKLYLHYIWGWRYPWSVLDVTDFYLKMFLPVCRTALSKSLYINVYTYVTRPYGRIGSNKSHVVGLVLSDYCHAVIHVFS